jgi:hypothetical protein
MKLTAVYNADGSGVKVGWFDNGNPSYAGRLAPGYMSHNRRISSFFIQPVIFKQSD